MRAAVITAFGGPEVLQIQQVATPEPAADQVRVRVHAAGLNRADLLQRLGRYPAPRGVPAQIPGLEIAGEVDAIGPEVQRWQVGDRVFGIVGGGAHAEYVVTPEDLLAPIPPNLDDQAAGAVPEVWMTAYDALYEQAEVRIGERVLIHAAASGVGTAAIQLGLVGGASVWGTVRDAAKRQALLDLGVRELLPTAGFAEAARQATAGAGMDVVLDFVGGPYLQANVETLAMHGRLVLIGTLGGSEATLDLGMLMRKRLRMIGTVLRSRSRAEKAGLTAKFSADVVPLLASGKLRPIVDCVFPLEAIADAHRYMETNANIGKIVLEVYTSS